MATQLTANGPQLKFSPPQAPGSTRPPLEVITMPMWLWVDSPCAQAVVGPDTIVDRIVVTSVAWTFVGGGFSGTPLTCNGTSALHGPGIPYDPAYNPSAPVVPPGVPQPCVTTVPGQPYYAPTTIAGVPTTTGGLVSLKATVNWDVTFSVNGAAAANVPGWPVVVPPAAQPLQFRVGEIQALVTQP